MVDVLITQTPQTAIGHQRIELCLVLHIRQAPNDQLDYEPQTKKPHLKKQGHTKN